MKTTTPARLEYRGISDIAVLTVQIRRTVPENQCTLYPEFQTIYLTSRIFCAIITFEVRLTNACKLQETMEAID